jgi:hypothetical protein
MFRVMPSLAAASTAALYEWDGGNERSLRSVTFGIFLERSISIA